MARMAGWVVILSAVVRIWSLPRALRLVSIQTKQAGEIPADQELPTAIDAILRANVSVFKPICWKRAAVLHRYLGLRGTGTTIVFGVRKEPEGELKGHAWLEYEGQPIFEPAAPCYTVTYTFPSDNFRDLRDLEASLLTANQDY